MLLYNFSCEGAGFVSMNETKLKGYIPLAAPLNWEPATGDEPPFRVLMSFTTNWFTNRTGVNFSMPYHTDPTYRFNCLLRMKEYIKKTFPQIPYFSEHDKGGFEQECATVSGVFGVCLVAMVYGLKVTYSNSNWPAIDPGSHLSVDSIKKLKPFDLTENPVVIQLLDQMRIINERWGKIDGFLNFQGILNNAFKIRGTEILMDMIDDPGFCKHLFEHIEDTMERLFLMVQEKQQESGFNIDGTSTSNCVVNMISPETYAEFLLPYDKKLMKAFNRLGIHSCNWVIDPYIEGFKKVGELGYIDFGYKSDLAKVKMAFPNATREAFYTPSNLVTKTEKEVEKDIERIFMELYPCELCLPDIDDFIPDEKLIRFYELAMTIASRF
jgi:Uroporphyrinogen decarboxylase (URO-D).